MELRKTLRQEGLHRAAKAAVHDENNGNIGVDYIGYFENIDDDFAYVAKRLGVYKSVPRRNASRHESYKAYYCETTREIVRTIYSRDIEVFGYDFESASVADRIAQRDAALP